MTAKCESVEVPVALIVSGDPPSPPLVADIDCVGCTHEGRHTPYCEGGCEIRKCAAGRAVTTCAECAAYGCENLAGFLAVVPDAKANLGARRPA